jgi:uncharacterized protein YihD (DUF1040 family)
MRRFFLFTTIIFILSIFLLPTRFTTAAGASSDLEDKLKEIIIPEVEMRDVPLKKAILKLSKLSKKYSEDHKRINILLMGTQTEATVSINLSNISLYEAIKYLAISAGLQMKIDDYAVVLKKKAEETPSKY